jgi:2-haloacid dehalogenase
MTDNPRLDGIKACVFDAYGTLFDVHSAVGVHRAALGPKADAVSATWRDKQLQYTWLRSLMDAHTEFWSVTGDALDFALEAHGIDDSALRDALMQAYLELNAYPEVGETLRGLKDAGFQLAILSNGSPDMLAAAVGNAGLGSLFDAVLSVEDVGIFKPDRRVYQLACDRLGVTPSEITFLSSNAWDVRGAANFGFQVVWINRFSQPADRLPGEPKGMIQSLDQLPPLLGV